MQSNMMASLKVKNCSLHLCLGQSLGKSVWCEVRTGTESCKARERNFCMKNFLARVITSSNDDTLTLVRVAFGKEGIVTPVLLTEASLCGKEHAI
jgi:hypothetical protein